MTEAKKRRGRRPGMVDREQFSFVLPGDMRENLRKLAEHEGNSEASVARRILGQGLTKALTQLATA
jgi:hypothetical protein